MIESRFVGPVNELFGDTENVGCSLDKIPLVGSRLGRELTVGDLVGVAIKLVFFVGFNDLRTPSGRLG